jgi:histidyl-tRNA synthetase
VGAVTDIVEKEMFSFQRGKSALSLRPEGTAGIVRAYIEAGFPKNAPIQRLFNIGPMFRYERPQKGRERMFTQFDVEAIGSLDPRLDAEIIRNQRYCRKVVLVTPNDSARQPVIDALLLALNSSG